MKELLLGVNQLPIDDSLGRPVWERSTSRGNLGHGILKPDTIGSSSVTGEFFLDLAEEFVLAD